MTKNYDNWERLVRAVLRRVHDRQIALDHSSSTISSYLSSLSSTRLFDHRSLVQYDRNDLPTDYSDLQMDHNDWKAMLPPDKNEVLFTSASMGFFLDQKTGKNSFMLGCSKLQLLPVKESERCWSIENNPDSRFSEVAELVGTWGLFIEARIKARILSPETFYAAYLVFKYNKRASPNSKIESFYRNYADIESSYEHLAIESSSDEQDYCYYEEQAPGVQLPWGKGENGRIVANRTDGWMEIQICDFYVGPRYIGEIDVKLLELGDYSKTGLIVEGIEFRPLDTPIRPIMSKKNERNTRGKGLFSNLRIF